MDNDAVMRPKSPKAFGKNKYLVELFLTERIVVTVYADTEESAACRAQAAPYRNEAGVMAIPCAEGVSHAHFDEDFDFSVKLGEVQQDDATEEDG